MKKNIVILLITLIFNKSYSQFIEPCGTTLNLTSLQQNNPTEYTSYINYINLVNSYILNQNKYFIS
jgi:hypothetical protein